MLIITICEKYEQASLIIRGFIFTTKKRQKNSLQSRCHTLQNVIEIIKTSVFQSICRQKKAKNSVRAKPGEYGG